MAEKIAVKNLYKVFGPQPEQAIDLLLLAPPLWLLAGNTDR